MRHSLRGVRARVERLALNLERTSGRANLDYLIARLEAARRQPREDVYESEEAGREWRDRGRKLRAKLKEHGPLRFS